jgi:hypothetical protein
MSQPATRQDSPNIFVRLTGEWSLTRTIDGGVSMNGAAAIGPRGDGSFDYSEQCRFQLADGRIIDGERRYIFEPSGDGFTALFAEAPPRLFHHVVLTRIGRSFAGSGVHLCGDDRYDSRYEFRADGSFVIEHAVNGPRKRYTIHTTYTRQ